MCGCGRSPSGQCCGWHKLTEEEYLLKKAEYDAKQAEDSAKDAEQ